MYTKRTTIINKTGLHARPASIFVKEAKKFESKINITNLKKPDTVGNAKTIFSVLAQALSQGTEVEIGAEGPDEQEAVDTLIALIDGGFGE